MMLPLCRPTVIVAGDASESSGGESAKVLPPPLPGSASSQGQKRRCKPLARLRFVQALQHKYDREIDSTVKCQYVIKKGE
jgi:hypothetical protein